MTLIGLLVWLLLLLALGRRGNRFGGVLPDDSGLGMISLTGVGETAAFFASFPLDSASVTVAIGTFSCVFALVGGLFWDCLDRGLLGLAGDIRIVGGFDLGESFLTGLPF